MGKIIAQLEGNQIIVTRYDYDGQVIPNNISQEKRLVALIKGNIDEDKVEKNLEPSDIAVPRGEFLYKLLSMVDDEGAKYSEYAKGLYSSKDMNRGITWSEVAYLLYYVGGLKKTLDWRKITPVDGYKVCVLQEINNGHKVVNEKLAMYKNRIDMEYYLNSIRLGERFIPLPLYCAYCDLVEKSKEELEFILDMSMMFKKVSEEELSMLF